VGGADLVRRKNNFIRFTGILHQDRDCLETNLPEKNLQEQPRKEHLRRKLSNEEQATKQKQRSHGTVLPYFMEGNIQE
jgi:hypothetical protein